MLKVGLAGAATVASPAILRRGARAESGPIKIGMPMALTGALGSVGQQQKRGAEFYAKLQNAKGGILGRPIELLIEDTAGNPANCVRKAQEMVERRELPPADRHHAVVGGPGGGAQARRMGLDLHFVRQRRRPADRREPGAELLPRQHLGPDGHARGVALSAHRQAAEVLRPGARLRLGPQQRAGLRAGGAQGQEGVHRQGLRADRHQGLFALHHQDPPVRRRRRLPGAAGRRQQRVPVPGAAVPPAREGQAADRDRRSRQHPRGGRRGARPDRILALQLHLRPPAEQRVRRRCGRRSTAPIPTPSRASSGSA